MSQAAQTVQKQTETLEVAGQILVPDVSGALYWPERRVLIISDLHLEKATAYGPRGLTLPPYDSRATLTVLSRVVAQTRPAHVIALGDSFHDRGAAARLDAEDAAVLRGLMEGRRWTWILGNHDPEPPAHLGGEACAVLALGALTFIHEPQPGPREGEIAGHLHPCASVRMRGRRLRRRCFATDGARLVMPAFGALTGGLCVLDEAFAPLFDGPPRAWMIGQQAVYPVAAKKLIPDAKW